MPIYIVQPFQYAFPYIYVGYKLDLVLSAAEQSFVMNQEVLRFFLQLGRNRNKLIRYRKVMQVVWNSLIVNFKWLIFINDHQFDRSG